MTSRIEKTVFISYRRTNLPWALAIYQELTHHGFDVFFDYLSIPSGDFENIIVENIKARAHFVVILTPSALERCNEPGDWLRREIETAMDEKRNVVPLMLESFDFGSQSTTKALIGKLENLKKYNGLRLHSEYFFEGMNKLREKFLNVSLDTVIHPISKNTQQITENHQVQAKDAMPTEKYELVIQELFEFGYKFTVEINDFDQAFRSFSEAIHINKTLRSQAEFNNTNNKLDNLKSARFRRQAHLLYTYRGNILRNKGHLSDAIADYNEALKFIPLAHFVGTGTQILYDHLNVFEFRGYTYQLKDDLTRAIQDYFYAIKFDTKNISARVLLISALKKLGRYIEAEEQEIIARKLIQKEDNYNRACLEIVSGHVGKGLELLKIALEKHQTSKEQAQNDPNLENIRDAPRFKELVDEQK